MQQKTDTSLGMGYREEDGYEEGEERQILIRLGRQRAMGQAMHVGA